jgi:hypothetical protein
MNHVPGWRYLKATVSFGLHMTRNSSFSLHGFIDVDWAGSVDDRKYTGAYLVFSGYTNFLEIMQKIHGCSFFYQD